MYNVRNIHFNMSQTYIAYVQLLVFIKTMFNNCKRIPLIHEITYYTLISKSKHIKLMSRFDPSLPEKKKITQNQLYHLANKLVDGS
jgi:hypothetical protein